MFAIHGSAAGARIRMSGKLNPRRVRRPLAAAHRRARFRRDRQAGTAIHVQGIHGSTSVGVVGCGNGSQISRRSSGQAEHVDAQALAPQCHAVQLRGGHSAPPTHWAVVLVTEDYRAIRGVLTGI